MNCFHRPVSRNINGETNGVKSDATSFWQEFDWKNKNKKNVYNCPGFLLLCPYSMSTPVYIGWHTYCHRSHSSDTNRLRFPWFSTRVVWHDCLQDLLLQLWPKSVKERSPLHSSVCLSDDSCSTICLSINTCQCLAKQQNGTQQMWNNEQIK